MDLQEIAALLHIEEKTRVHPSLKNINNAAMAKLIEADAEHASKPAEPEPVEETVQELEHDA
jgi:hypothetical protein